MEEGGVSLDTETQGNAPSSRNMYEILANTSLQDKPSAPLSDTEPTIHTMIPHADSLFWVKYGNKLRVNGTQEEVLHIC